MVRSLALASIGRSTMKLLGIVLLGLVLVARADDDDDAAAPRFRGSGKKDKLLVILLDGFRWDYADEHEMKSFARIKSIGVSTEFLSPAFPAMSFPNYYSLMTGLYVESHGMVMNYMYDQERNQSFKMLAELGANTPPLWFEEAEPLWVTAVKKGKRSFLYLWPGGEIKIHGVSPTKFEPYSLRSGLSTFRQHLDDALVYFHNDEADLAQIYCEYTDSVGHSYGPKSDEMKNALVELDFELETLFDKLKQHNLESKVNVLIVSDHGMTATDPKSVKRISLDAFITMNNVDRLLGQGAIVGVFPKSGYKAKIYNELVQSDDIHVWKREDLPERFHMKNNKRTPPIVVLAKKGVFITPVKENEAQIPYVLRAQTESYKGFHGYDVEEVEDMKGIFYGFGPGFEENEKHPGINNVDVYNIMMHLLDLEPLPNNGSWTSVYKMIKSENSASALWSPGFLTLLSCIEGAFIYSFIALFNSLWL